MSVAPGDFANIPGISKFDAKYFSDAYIAIEKAGNWEDLKKTQVESFMFSPPDFLGSITSQMKLMNQHSGASFGITMRNMEYIAKNGWDAFVALFKKNR